MLSEEHIPAWDHTKTYRKGDLVYYFHVIFKCRRDTSGHPEDDDWYDVSDLQSQTVGDWNE